MKFPLCGISNWLFISERRPLFGARRLFSHLAVTILVFNIFLCDKADAQFASQFSMAVGEEYNDNIFFSKQNKEYDFITQITPTFTFLFQPLGAAAEPLKLNISPTAQIFARHPDENNFGRNFSLDGVYTHRWSPPLTFYLADAMQTWGGTRTTGVGAGPLVMNAPGASTGPLSPGLSPSQNLGTFISNGDTFSNHFEARADYSVAPNVTLSGSYENIYTKFLSQGGSEIANVIGARGVYNWRQEHNLYAGYRIGFLSPREGKNTIVHTFDIGDDYFSQSVIQLTPTLTLSGSTGISVNTGNDGPGIVNDSTLTLVKVWETASFAVGLQKGLTNSFGVSGVSDTLTLFGAYDIRLSEKFSARAAVDYSRYDTDDTDFNTLEVAVDLQYAITSWLCPSLRYSHRRLDGGHGAPNTNSLTQGNTFGNSVFLNLTAHFDIWPNVGRSKVKGCGGQLTSIVPQRR